VLIFTKIAEIKPYLDQQRAGGISIGFVPTMGALHAGHTSLVAVSKSETKLTVCSIFINPTQFNDKKDLERYPRTPEKDLEMLKNAGCDVVFMPSAEEMYPKTDNRTFDFGYLDKVLEGAHRPGHFNGVGQIVSRLFDIVKPDKAFFGNKDYQQVMIIKELVKTLKYDIEIVVCPTLREKDGLAMSSRNALLSEQDRKDASLIPALMKEAQKMKTAGKNVSEIKSKILSALNNENFRADYFAICDGDTLKEISSFSESKNPVALIACFVGKIRLIDNIALT
jgi:pantoate--beta-alanine ligase